MRLDKWLWHARFFKSRTLASRFVEQTRPRLDGRVVDKPHAAVTAGAVLTLALGPRVRVVRVVALGERRGPAIEARTLYEEINET
jgi:ribosome-associated heat shock protein Hsp15